MQGLTNPNLNNNKSASTCSFCRNPNHQATVCPHVPVIWKSLQMNMIPVVYMKKECDKISHWTPLKWMLNPHQWGDLYKATEKAQTMQVKYLLRKAKKKGTTLKEKRIPKCGWCGTDGHTRRTCKDQKLMVSRLKQANKNYRRHVYDSFVKEQGLSDGALIRLKVTVAKSYNTPEVERDITTLCTGVNWDTINLFADYKPSQRSWRDNEKIRQTVGCTAEKIQNIEKFIKSQITLRVDNQAIREMLRGGSSESGALGLPLQGGAVTTTTGARLSFYVSNNVIISDVKVISRAPQVLAEDWVDGYADEMTVIFKKYSKAELDYIGAISHINEWSNR